MRSAQLQRAQRPRTPALLFLQLMAAEVGEGHPSKYDQGRAPPTDVSSLRPSSQPGNRRSIGGNNVHVSGDQWGWPLCSRVPVLFVLLPGFRLMGSAWIPSQVTLELGHRQPGTHPLHACLLPIRLLHAHRPQAAGEAPLLPGQRPLLREQSRKASSGAGEGAASSWRL